MKRSVSKFFHHTRKLGDKARPEDFVEIIEGSKLKQGPKVPFELDTSSDQGVLDRKNRIIITSKDHGLIVYDHQAGTFIPYNSFKLRECRRKYAAILQ